MRTHEDERAVRYCDVFDGTPGDVNVFLLNPGQVSAWHRHQEQTDQFIVLFGDVVFGMSAFGGLPQYKLVKSGGPEEKITFEPGTWHGYQNVGDTPALLLMYLSHKYEDGWDEERRTLEEMPWNP